MLGRDDVDLESLYLAGMANLQAGNSAASVAAFARAVRVSPEDPRIATALALRKISQGDVDGGFASLTAIAAADKGELADLALIGMRMRRREHDAALTAVDVLDRKLPGQALVADLRGRVLQSIATSRVRGPALSARLFYLQNICLRLAVWLRLTPVSKNLMLRGKESKRCSRLIRNKMKR